MKYLEQLNQIMNTYYQKKEEELEIEKVNYEIAAQLLIKIITISLENSSKRVYYIGEEDEIYIREFLINDENVYLCVDDEYMVYKINEKDNPRYSVNKFRKYFDDLLSELNFRTQKSHSIETKKDSDKSDITYNYLAIYSSDLAIILENVDNETIDKIINPIINRDIESKREKIIKKRGE